MAGHVLHFGSEDLNKAEMRHLHFISQKGLAEMRHLLTERRCFFLKL